MGTNFRITTNGLYRTYRTNLNNNNKKLSDAMIGVETQRKFNSYAEDPAAASKAWRLRRSYWRTGDQIDNNNYIISKYESAYSAMTAVIDGDVGNGEYGLGLDGILSSVKAISDSAGSSRTALGKELRQVADNIVSMMNSKYGDEFIFAGSDGRNVPFEWNEDKTKLLYRGIDISTEQPKALADFNLTEEDLNGLKAEDLALTAPVSPGPEPEAPTMPSGVAEPEKPEKPAGMTDDEYNAALSDYTDVMEKYYYRFQTPESKDSPEYKENYYQFAQDALDYAVKMGDYTKAVEQYNADMIQYNADKKDYDAEMEQYNKDLAAYHEKYDPISDKLTALRTEPVQGQGESDSAFADRLRVYQGVQAFGEYAAEYAERNGYSYEEGLENYEKLQTMAGEATYVDIGLGMQERDDRLIHGSAFNSAVSGLEFLGYGKDENLVMVIKELGEIFSAADEKTGAYASDEDRARADELLDRLQDGVRYSQDQHVQLSADAKYLKTNLKQLETVKSELDKQIVDTEDLDMADAITSQTWAKYCYDAALRIGTSILSQSLIDYMN